MDIAGLVRGASKGEGLGNQFLSHIREVDAVAHVVRCFDDDNVIHVENRVDPLADIATINTELCLKDLDTVSKRLDRARKQAKGSDPIEKLAAPLCERLVAHLDQGKPARTFEIGDNEKEQAIVYEMQLLTSKRMFYVGNVAEGALSNLAADAHFAKLVAFGKSEGAPVVPICAAIEEQIRPAGARRSSGLPGQRGPGRAGLERGDPQRLRAARADHVPDRGQARGAGMDGSQGRDCAASRWRDPYRLRARLHQGRSDLVGRPDQVRQ